MRLQKIRILFIIILLSISGGLYSQVNNADTGYYDTTDYVPSFYKGSLDYNLMIAASKGYAREINRLIMLGADIFSETNQGVTPLIFAISNNQTKVAKMLIDYGSDPNKRTSQNETPLHIAVKNENAEIAEALIRADADINATDKYDATPLHYASVYDFFKLVDMLLYYDASIDKKTVEGTTPLLAAIWAGNADIADLLIQSGANTEARDNEAYTPFLMAALTADTLIMRLLYKKGVDIYAVNNLNYNALALVIIAGSPSATSFLLKIGNKWVNQEYHAISPFNVASKYRRKDILKILEENKIPGNLKYEIDQVDIMASTRFNVHDIYSGVSLSFKEPYLNGGIIFGFDTKLWNTRVLVHQSENMFYQYMHKGSVVYAGLFKDFSLTNNVYRSNYGITASLSAGYTFGNEFKGTTYTLQNKFTVIPSFSFKWTRKNFSLSLGADYMNTEFYHIGPLWLRFGASYNLYFDNLRTKAKSLKWY